MTLDYENIVKNAKNIILCISKDFKILEFNREAERLYATKREDVIGKNYLNLFIPGDFQDGVIKDMQKVIDGEDTIGYVNPIQSKNGNLICVQWNVSRLNDSNGIPVGIIAFGQDISKQREVEERIKESEERFRSMIEQTTDAVFCYEYDPPISIDLPVEEQVELLYNGVLADCNLVCAKAYGAERVEDVVGRKLTDLFGTTPSSLNKLFRNLIVGGYRIIDGIGVEKLPNGEERFFLNNGNAVIENNELLRIWGTYRDITERKIIENELLKEKKIFEQITQTSPTGIVIANKDGEITYANSQAEIVLGLAKDEITQRTYNAPSWRITHYDGSPYPNEELPFQKVKNEQKKIYDIRHAIERPNGERVFLSINATPEFTDKGEFNGMVANVDDITDKIVSEKRMKESEEQFRNIIESTPLGIHMYQLEPDGNLIFIGANPAADKILGVDNSQFVGKTIEEAFPPLVETEVPSRYRLTAGEGKPWYTEQISYEDNQISGAFEVHCFQTSPGKMAALFLDITERKKAEEKVKQSEENYRLLVENMTDMIAKTDKNGNFDFVSPSYCKTFGKTEDELLGKHFMPLVHEEDRESTAKARKKILRYPYTARFEQRALTKKGWRWIAWVDTAILDSEDNVIGGIGVGRDVTERVLAEQALRESEEKFRTLAEQSLVGLAIIQDNQTKYLNKKMAEIVGFPYEEIKNWTMFDYSKIVHPDYVELVKEQADKKQKGSPDVIEDYEFCINTKKGESKWVHIYSKTVSFEGRPADFICQVDITNRKKVEKQIISSEEKYRKAYSRAEFYKDLFAHDINNILQNISMATELNLLKFKEMKEVEDLEESHKIILEQVKRGANLVANIRKISEVEEKHVPLKSIEVISILQSSISFIKKSFQHKELDIQLKNDFKEIIGMANNFIQEIFDNLLINAIQHTNKPKISILIKITKQEIENKNYIKMQFIDNGRGIPDDIKEEIFLRSFNKSRTVGGMGLGLSLVKKIVESYKGKIWVEDKIKGDHTKGSNFTLLIPELVQEQDVVTPIE